MGSDAHIYLFDEKIFKTKIVPAFQNYCAGQAVPDWFEFIRVQIGNDFDYDPPNFDLKNHCDLLDNLGCIDAGRYYETDRVPPRKFWLDTGSKHRNCRNNECQSRNLCPIYRFPKDKYPISGRAYRGTYEHLCNLFTATMAWVSQAGGPFVGRSCSPHKYKIVLDIMDVPTDHILRLLLDKLGNRGFILGYGFANGDGVHGWLYSNECQILLNEMQKLKLPDIHIDYSQPTNIQFNKAEPTIDVGDLPSDVTGFEKLNYKWHLYCLKIIMEFAEKGAKQELGLVWMNDNCPEYKTEFYELGSPNDWSVLALHR